ncbi:putative trans-zeatin O-beta-D-glucosyltransferase [Helianthus annuus]|uniref:Glycosyltransferase n=1 Tax=Helianthus annuus TaxID=4232 RepID=A0A251VPA2_HELAN|nr:zeatin O-glucosyltransferase [Helianthus annuus]KAF5821321.1 putative trans-zeatin O-beta-D-glucosyltransferase [Helianthus annuus]KAJ0621901.1 putative trans-zeatin O-beta-D-glucosyltransferase [Helianthus annuus]KAJ0626271.1 putative trans-zeatin O-beta-D-glucosyltransferase [Helianthus annuus]KAJ0803961.1 putative trans-zeatin O-beta-D-glucosyltransferase [Helianthus annuus]
MAHSTNNELSMSPAAVVMVPLPLQGHLNQLLHLSRLISDRNIPVHFVSTTTHCRQAKLRVQGWNPLAVATIHFHELHTPNYVSPTPNPNSKTRFPSHLQPLCEATTQLRHPVASLLRKLSTTTHRLVIIHDSLMGSVIQDFVSLPNAESYTFHSVSAFTIFLYTLRTISKEFQNITDPEVLTNDHLSFEDCFTAEFKKFTSMQHDFAKLNSGRIYNSCRIIEKPMLDLLENEERNRNKKLWALGPFNPIDIKRTTKREKGYRCLQWLDKQEPNTVIFVSFGTTTSLTKEQIIEIAIGLEKSEQKFIWVLREADKGDASNDYVTLELPKGYEDRLKGRGLVVREWAPQLEILAHQATGGFMSHCGWNSCMESISMGVPIVAWPMHSDQPTNSVLITNILKVGVTVKDWKWRDQIVVAEDVENAVRAVMTTKEGAEMRMRAVEMGGGVRESVKEDGVSWLQLQSFIAHITR